MSDVANRIVQKLWSYCDVRGSRAAAVAGFCRARGVGLALLFG